MPVVCPYCGISNDDEFVIDRTNLVARPSLNVVDATRKHDALKRQAPAGVQLERWGHFLGCGRSFNVARDSRTREIVQTYATGLPPPEPADA